MFFDALRDSAVNNFWSGRMYADRAFLHNHVIHQIVHRPTRDAVCTCRLAVDKWLGTTEKSCGFHWKSVYFPPSSDEKSAGENGKGF
jgi:hypothetical protein